MSTPAHPAEAVTSPGVASYSHPSESAFSVLRRLIGVERLGALRELDDFLLRDIGASGDDIWRVRRLRNGERPTLLVG